jgi:hypothetical protein
MGLGNVSKSALIASILICGGLHVSARDHSADYQMGTFISSTVATDGTITSTLHGDGTTTAGSIFANQIAVYTIRVGDGIWSLNTYTQNKDSMIRSMGMTPMHLKAEKNNPLDILRGGDKILFRVEKHHLLNGVETSIFIPFANNPDKEFRFIGYFSSSTTGVPQPAEKSDNVKAMCDAHKLSADLERQFCGTSASSPAVPESPEASSIYSALDKKMVENLNQLTCSQIKASLLSNPQVVESLLRYLPASLASIRARCPVEAQVLQ